MCRKCYKKDWNRKNKEKINKYNTEWNKAHPERRKATLKRYDTSEKGRIMGLMHRHIRLAREAIGTGLGAEEWYAIKKRQGWHCYYCSRKKKMTIEHVLPLSRGGEHSVHNIVAACERCNKQKRNMTEEEYFAYLKRRGL